MTIFAKPPPGPPNLRPHLRIETGESRIFVEPGPDDWFGETDITPLIPSITVYTDSLPRPRFRRSRRLLTRFRDWRTMRRFQLTRGAA